MDQEGCVLEWMYQVDRSTIEGCTQYLTVRSDCEIFDPGVIVECPNRSDGVIERVWLEQIRGCL